MPCTPDCPCYREGRDEGRKAAVTQSETGSGKPRK